MHDHARPALFTLDDLIEAAFDRASLVTDDRKVAAELASRTVGRWLARVERPDLVRLLRGKVSGRPLANSIGQVQDPGKPS